MGRALGSQTKNKMRRVVLSVEVSGHCCGRSATRTSARATGPRTGGHSAQPPPLVDRLLQNGWLLVGCTGACSAGPTRPRRTRCCCWHRWAARDPPAAAPWCSTTDHPATADVGSTAAANMCPSCNCSPAATLSPGTWCYGTHGPSTAAESAPALFAADLFAAGLFAAALSAAARPIWRGCRRQFAWSHGREHRLPAWPPGARASSAAAPSITRRMRLDRAAGRSR